jgi:hypothetical protein
MMLAGTTGQQPARTPGVPRGKGDGMTGSDLDALAAALVAAAVFIASIKLLLR